MAKVVVLGAGMMGSALCVPILDRGHEVHLVGTHLDSEIIDHLRKTGSHLKMKSALPEGFAGFYQHDEFDQVMAGADVLVLGVSSAGVTWAGQKTAGHVGSGIPVISVSKGLVWDGKEFVLLPDVLASCWPEDIRNNVAPAAVVGPCIAGELVRRVQTCVSFVSRERSVAVHLAELFHTPYYHVRPSDDLVGLEVCAALKNAYALAVGFGRGINERQGHGAGSVAMHNHEAAVFAQAAVEMAMLVDLLGGRPTAALGMPGVGDLFVTCQGGRTSRLGRWLGLGLSLPEAIEKMQGATLEALDIISVISQALPSLQDRGFITQDDLPLMRHLCAIVNDGAPVDVPFGRFFGDL